ncbi:hypothetical protein VTO73DRAFT_8459 [Trametes versicolor]
MTARSKHWMICFGKRKLWWADSSIDIDRTIAFLQKFYPASFYLSQRATTGDSMTAIQSGAHDFQAASLLHWCPSPQSVSVGAASFSGHLSCGQPSSMTAMTMLPPSQTTYIAALTDPCTERVQDLSVRDYEGDGLGFPNIITSFKGNELRRCEFHLRDDQYTGPPFQTFFHDGYAPRLRTLQLESSPYLPRNRFPTLTHLILECSQVASYTFQDLQEFLSGCPALQVLHLSMVSTSNMQLEAPSTPSATPRGPLHFRHLRRLSVIDAPLGLGDDYYFGPGPTAAVIARRGALPQVLLSSMVFPPQCLLYTSPLPSGNIQAFADHMSTLLTPSSMRIVDAKQSYVAPSKSEQISLVLVQPSESRGGRYDVPFVSYNQREASSVKQDVLRVIATSPLFSAIRELWADTGSMYFLGGKDSILWSLPRLEYISLCCARKEKFALYNLLKVLSTVQEGSLVCPELDTLVLITYLPLKPLIARMRSILVVRKDSGHPLKHLAVYVDLEEVGWKVLEEARGLGDLVEHFFLNDNEDVPESEWERFWDERVPAGCDVVDEIHDHWPVWVERVDPLDM